MEGLDHGTYYFFRGHADELSGLRSLMLVGDFLGSLWVVGAVLMGVVVLLVGRQKHQAAGLSLGLVLAGGLLVEAAIWGLHVARPREPDPDPAYAGIESTPGFPSRTAFLASLGFGLLALTAGDRTRSWQLRWSIYGGCLVVILLIGFSQLFLRLHFLSQLFAGWLAAAIVLLFYIRLAPGLPSSPNGNSARTRRQGNK